MVFLFVLIVMILTIIFSSIKIELQNFNFTSENKQHIDKEYIVKIKWVILRKITIAKLVIKN